MIAKKKAEDAPLSKVNASPADKTNNQQPRGTSANWQEAISPAKKLPTRPGASWAQCPRCLDVFSTSANFYRHRKGDCCIDPATAGLTLDERGIWTRRQPARFTCGVCLEAKASTQDGHDLVPEPQGFINEPEGACVRESTQELACIGVPS